MNQFKPMLFSTLKNYSKKQLLQDVTSGVIVAIIALPLSIALAIASGVSPEQGIYTAIIAGFIISFFGGSKIQIGGPSATFVAVIYQILLNHGMQGLIVATIMAGFILILMGLLKLGTLIKFIPRTITIGFSAGIAVGIFVQQIKDFLGLELSRSPSDFTDRIYLYFLDISTFNASALIVGAIALVILFGFPYITKKIPSSLVAIIATTALASIINLNVDSIGSLYDVSSKFPAPSIPSGINIELIKIMLPDAFTIALLAAIESLLSCVVSDSMIGSKHKPNAELIAQGLGNIASGLFGGLPATGALARTAANAKNGGRTPIAGMVHAISLLLVLVFLMPLASMIPMPTLAATLMLVAYNMSEWREFKAMLKAPKSDIIVLLLTFLLTIFFDLVIALSAGMIAAALLFVHSMATNTDINMTQKENKTYVFDFYGPMFFGASDKLNSVLESINSNAEVIILRMKSVPSMDATAYNALKTIFNECQEKNITLILSQVNVQPMTVLTNDGFDKIIGSENLCPHIDDALQRAKEIIAA